LSKKRVDLRGDGKPLTDNPFGALVADRDRAPEQPQTDPKESRRAAASDRKFKIAKTRKGGLPVFVEKRAKGKTVTVIRNITGDAEDLLKTLKKRCGAGGVIRDGDVEIQGDHRSAVEAFLHDSSG